MKLKPINYNTPCRLMDIILFCESKVPGNFVILLEKNDSSTEWLYQSYTDLNKLDCNQMYKVIDNNRKNDTWRVTLVKLAKQKRRVKQCTLNQSINQ